MKYLLRGICAISLFLLISCSSEKQEEIQTAPAISRDRVLEILPSDATSKTTTFSASLKRDDITKAEIQWFVNGIPIKNASGKQFSPSELRKGDTLQVKVIIDNHELISNLIILKNIPPTIGKARILPKTPKANDILKVNVIGNDLDGDEITFRYKWYRNDELSADNVLLEGPFQRGDSINVEITPFDDENYGQTVKLTTKIYNSPPVISKDIVTNFDGFTYTTKINATDPDGDLITYILKQGPEGMTIDPESGIITWKVTRKDKGEHDIIISVRDGHGGEVIGPLTTTISFAPQE